MSSVSSCSSFPRRSPVDRPPHPKQAPPLARRVFHGTLIHSRSLTEIEYLTDALLGVNEAGVIAFLDKDVREEKQVASKLEERGWKGVQVITLKRGEFLIPG